MNPFEMVVLIVAITAVASIFRAKYGIRRTRHGDEVPIHDTATLEENRRLREELKGLKDRVATLEAIATDSSSSLDRQIEALRQRD